MLFEIDFYTINIEKRTFIINSFIIESKLWFLNSLILSSQMTKRIIYTVTLLLILMTLTNSVNLLYYSQLPVNRLSLFKSLLSMDRLKENLDTTFNTKWENKVAYYIRTKLTEQYLNEVSNELAQYNNVMIGSNNQVQGQKNLVIGDDNTIQGSQNWVFSQGFNGKADKDLIMDHWQVDVGNADQMLVDAHLAIRQW